MVEHFLNRRKRVRAIIAPSADSDPTAERCDAALQLADDIREQGSPADVAADSARAAIPNTFPPRRPKNAVKDWA